MARHLLSARQVQTAAEGDHGDGDGLILRVKSKKPHGFCGTRLPMGSAASWVLDLPTAAASKLPEHP